MAVRTGESCPTVWVKTWVLRATVISMGSQSHTTITTSSIELTCSRIFRMTTELLATPLKNTSLYV